MRLVLAVIAGCVTIGCASIVDGPRDAHYSFDMMGMERGRRVYHVWCDEDVSQCWRGARAACRGEYVAKERDFEVYRRGIMREYEGNYLVRCVKPQ